MSAGDGQARRGRVVSDADELTRAGGLRRVVPADWPFAVRTGVESVLAGWLLVVVPTLREYGLEVDWNEDLNTRILLRGAEFYRPIP